MGWVIIVVPCPAMRTWLFLFPNAEITFVVFSSHGACCRNRFCKSICERYIFYLKTTLPDTASADFSKLVLFLAIYSIKCPQNENLGAPDRPWRNGWESNSLYYRKLSNTNAFTWMIFPNSQNSLRNSHYVSEVADFIIFGWDTRTYIMMRSWCIMMHFSSLFPG